MATSIDAKCKYYRAMPTLDCHLEAIQYGIVYSLDAVISQLDAL